MYLVLLAHLIHVVSVAEDEVLFFLKRDRRILGGAWQRKQKGIPQLGINVDCVEDSIWMGLYSDT